MKAKKEIAAFGLAGALVAGGYALEHSHTTSTPKDGVNHTAAPTVPGGAADTPRPESHKDKVASIEAQMQNAQKGLKAVSAAKLREFVRIIDTKGYEDTHKYMHGVRRFVVYGPDGTQYTDELDYAKPYGSKDNRLNAVTVYVQHPGEPFAKHVTEDGIDPVDADGGVRFPIDGVVDEALGYDNITSKQIRRDVNKYGALSGGVEAVRSIVEGGKVAQQDYTRAVDITLSKES